MKRCPDCKSVCLDSDTVCGVCGVSLADVASESFEKVDDEVLEDEARERLEDKRLVHKLYRLDRTKALAGLALGLLLIASGVVLVTFGQSGYPLSQNMVERLVVGFLLIPFGLWVTASVVMGGLGEGAWYNLWQYRVFRIWGNWMRSEDTRRQDENEGGEKAENVEARGEGDKAREEREKTGFD